MVQNLSDTMPDKPWMRCNRTMSRRDKLLCGVPVCLRGVVVRLLAVLMRSGGVLLGMLMVTLGVLKSRRMMMVRSSGMVGGGRQMTLMGGVLGAGHGHVPLLDNYWFRWRDCHQDQVKVISSEKPA